MCGICGIYNFTHVPENQQILLDQAINQLRQRGPEVQQSIQRDPVLLGHTRLSIIDTSDIANQPFTEEHGRYSIVFNGEIYNYKNLREQLRAKGYAFVSQSDTEVLLKWMIEKGIEGLGDLQGFFAFAFYDHQEQSLLLVRDRFGIKPMLYSLDEEKLLFASEMKAIAALGAKRELDYDSMMAYFQLNYIPAPWSIYTQVRKLMPGCWMRVNKKEISQGCYYQIPRPEASCLSNISYAHACKLLEEKLEAAVVKRLVSDVPLGAFLSGGIDSSIITALAARHVKHLNTFSIGFRDEPMFDETHYAQSVAKMHRTNHTVFSLTHNDLLDCLYPVLDYIDEPFADSSALAVYILSQQTRQKVTVALSGDGADEMFAGYNKHMAEWQVRNPGLPAHLLSLATPLLQHLPQSRNSFLGNKIRQMHRFGQGMKLTPAERYWRWASFANEAYPQALLGYSNLQHYQQRKQSFTRHIQGRKGLNEVLYTDMQLVLPNDMLTKVDLMSMANSLEVRVPFLDHDLVNFAFSLPSEYKIDQYARKKILRDTFRPVLPPELFNRPKQGFEVPLLKWFRTSLKDKITRHWLDDDYITEQKIFNPQLTKQLKKKLFSNNPGEVHAQIWALIVFQHWFEKQH